MTKKSEHDEAAFTAFLAALAEHGGIAKAAAAAGLSLDLVARRERTDSAFKERMKDARAVRRYLIADALLEEAIGHVVTDPINGAERRVRNVAVLQRVAVKDGELDPEQKGVAINNINASAVANDPKLVAAVQENSKRLWSLLRGERPPAVIDVTPQAEQQSLPAPIDEDEDLL